MSFQPICGLCLSDCDRRGSVTSCSHFLCSRCLSRLPTAAPCPLCRRPCRMMCLDQPEVQPLLQTGTAALEQSSRVVNTQLRHHQQISRRMRQALEMLHGRFQSLRRQRDEEHAAHVADTQKMRALESECRRLREQLSRVGTPPKPLPSSPAHLSRSLSMSVSPSHGHRHSSLREHLHHHAHASTRSISTSAGTSARDSAPRSSHGHAMDGPPFLTSERQPPSPAPLNALGWSSSSHIAKRRRASVGDGADWRETGSFPPLNLPFDRTASLHNAAHARTSTSTASAAMGFNSNDLLTPRSQMLAALRPSP